MEQSSVCSDRFVASFCLWQLILIDVDENAVNLAYGLIGLQDNYDLEGFEEKRQSALNALVAFSPRKAAPYVDNHFDRDLSSIDTIYNCIAIAR